MDIIHPKIEYQMEKTNDEMEAASGWLDMDQGFWKLSFSGLYSKDCSMWGLYWVPLFMYAHAGNTLAFPPVQLQSPL